MKHQRGKHSANNSLYHRQRKRPLKRLLRAVLCIALALGMCMGDLCTITAFAAEQLSQIPRLVDFSRPEALTWDDLGLEVPSQQGETSAETEPTAEAETETEGEAETEEETGTAENETEAGDEAEEETEEETEEAAGEEAALRTPETYYTLETDEPEGTLVRFEDGIRTYEVGDNEFVTIIGGYSGLYEDADGEVKEVDNILVAQEQAGIAPMAVQAVGENSAGDGADTDTVWENRAGDTHVMLPENMGDGQGFVLSVDGYSVELVPLDGDFGRSAVSGNAIRYNDVYENIDVQYTLIGNSLKEDIILLVPSMQNTFRYELCTGGLTAVQNERSISLMAEGEEYPKMILHAPSMSDAAGAVSDAVEITLTEENGHTYVTVTADAGWLAAPERAYPVRIDPSSFTVPNKHLWSYVIASDRPDYHAEPTDFAPIGYQDGWGNIRIYWVIVTDWDTVLTPNITQATFKIGQATDNSHGTGEIGFYSPTEVWDPNMLTWNYMLELGGIDCLFHDSTNTVGAGEILEFDVTDMLNGWASGTYAQVGMMMKSEYEPMSEDQMIYAMPAEELYSHDYVDLGPRIEIYWDGPINLIGMDIKDLTVEVDPVIVGSNAGGKAAVGVITYGLSQAESLVGYTLNKDGQAQAGGTTQADTELTAPDFTLGGAIPEAEREAPSGNWQSAGFISTVDLQLDTIYRFSAQATGYEIVVDPDTGENVPGTETAVSSVKESDSFLLYEVKETDLLSRIASHYGVRAADIRKDNHLPDQLTVAGDILFIRNPQTAEPYTYSTPSDLEQIKMDMLLNGRAQSCIFGHEPINLNTGNFYMEQEDAVVPDLGGDFGIVRSYNSRAAYFRSSFGIGWSSMLDERLMMLEDASVMYIRSDGSGLTFEPDGNGGYEAPAGYGLALTQTEEGWEIREADGTLRRFNVYGNILSVTDAQGHTTSYSYDEEYRLTGITSPAGVSFGLTMDEEDRVSSVTLPDGGVISYAYDGDGNLASVTNALGGVRRYEYDGKHRMTAWYDENGTCVVQNTYDEMDRVTAQTDANGATVTLAYGDGFTTATDVLGYETTYYYDAMKRITRIAYPDGAEEAYAYDEDGYLASFTDRAGVITSYTYDSMGRTLSETRGNAAWTYTYDRAGNPGIGSWRAFQFNKRKPAWHIQSREYTPALPADRGGKRHLQRGHRA